MKKLLIPALALVLLGQGCFSNPVVEEPTDSATEEPSLMVPAPGFEDVPEMIVEDTEEDPTEEDVNMQIDPNVETIKVSLESGNFSLTPNNITVEAGQQVEITVAENEGFHTFVIDEIDLKVSLRDGNTFTFFAPETPGVYTYYCDIGSHRSLGMEGTLIVE